MRFAIMLTAVTFAAMHACPPDPVPPQPDAADAAPPPVPDASPPPQPDAGPTTKGARACAAIKLVGCVEGQKPNCGEVLDKVVAEHQADPQLDCLIAARSKADVRSCCSKVKTACSRVDCP